MRATLAGQGALEALAGGASGTVLAWFPRAVYLRLAGTVIALVGPDVGPGPLHLGLDAPVPNALPGTSVRRRATALLVGDVAVDLRGRRVWRGAHPDPDRLRAASRLIVEVAGELGRRSALLRPPLSARADLARGCIAVDDLVGAAELLGGLGPGLTPAGDDVLGGVLFMRRLLGGERVTPSLSAAAGIVATTEISRAFVSWAARGQVLSAGHDLLVAAAGGDRSGAEAAARELVRVGETSGADFALGLVWALQPPG